MTGLRARWIGAAAGMGRSRHQLLVALACAVLGVLLLTASPELTASPGATVVVPYDIVYVRAPRYGEVRRSRWPEIFNPADLDPGGDLMLLHPDGSEELLVPGGLGAVTDPFVSFDAQWVYYVLFPNLQPDRLNDQRHRLPRDGADIYRINLETRAIERLTRQEFTPNTGAGNWDLSGFAGVSSRDTLGYGVLNLAPAPLAGGRIAFVSNRNGFLPTKPYTTINLQLYVMDEDGGNVTAIAPMTLGSAMHPMSLRDGRVMFSSYESQGRRDVRLWGVWAIYPDGRHWEPLVSAFHPGQAFHFQTQLTSGDIVVEDYYNLNNSGFGAFYRLPEKPPGGGPPFASPFASAKDRIEMTLSSGQRSSFAFPFSPRGMFSITPFTHGFDEAAPIGPDGNRVGKVTHPASAPNNDLLLVWTPGPANHLERPTTRPYVDGGLYLLRGGGIARSHRDLVPIKNDPRYNEMFPRAVVPYKAIYGIDEPVELPWLPNDGTLRAELPIGTPYGMVGTSSFYKRESFPGKTTQPSYDGLDVFNTGENLQSSNWEWQGSDAGKYSNSDIHAVRIVALEPTSHLSYGPNQGHHFFNHANERMRILGEIPLRKVGADGKPVLDPEGNPDTSFLARIPADTPFTFQMLDRDGLVLTMAQTWHQVRPGEVRADCGGCHAHSLTPLAFERTAAGRPGYKPVDLARQVLLLAPATGRAPTTRIVAGGAVNVEYYRDIRPILQRSCVGCHTRTKTPAPGNLVLDDDVVYENLPDSAYHRLPGDYARLALDREARWGHRPLAGAWRQTNASRYVRMFQSRRSLLVWKIFGRRLDGWTNADHPTEAVPGNPSTLPQGANPRDADLDYTGTIMPPPGSGVPPLTAEEKLTIARWVDLGAPIDLWRAADRPALGWFLDETRPTLTVSSPRPGHSNGPLKEIRVGVADAYTGVDFQSLSVTADVHLAGRRPGAELATLGAYVGDGIFSIPFTPAIDRLDLGRITVKVKDKQGNWTVQTVRFSIGDVPKASAGR